MVFDESRGVSFLFGGLRPDVRLYAAFEYDDGNWITINPSGNWPVGRGNFGMAYDPEREVVVMFGGFRGGFDYLGDTWEWDGTEWTELNP